MTDPERFGVAETQGERVVKIIEKPKDLEEAAKMLSAFSGKSHMLLTGIAVVCRKRKKSLVQFFAFIIKNPNFDINSCRNQFLYSSSSHQGVRVNRSDYSIFYFITYYKVSAGRRFTKVRAGFEIHI